MLEESHQVSHGMEDSHLMGGRITSLDAILSVLRNC